MNQAFSITITVKLCKFYLAQEVLILLNKAVLIALTQALVAHDDSLPHVLFQLLSLDEVKSKIAPSSGVQQRNTQRSTEYNGKSG
jgi:hypothetical protein